MAPAPGVGAKSDPRRLEVLPPLARPEPFDPLRKGLYTGDELMQGYTPSNPEGALDRKIARYFVAAGGRNPASAAEAIAQRLHDFGIDRALTAWLDGSGGTVPKVVGLMGSHATPRTDPEYASVAELGWRLARAGFLVATGGGPGLMEAANLGAYLAKYADRAVLDRAVAILRQAPAFESDHARYIEATRQVLADFPDGAVSLGVPTWVYPDEPVNLFSSHIAKYFSNSMREEGLIAIGVDRAHPTVQLPGSGGGADIASLAHRLIVIMAHDKRRLRERVDFITSPGYGDGDKWRARVGLPRGGPSVLITTLGVFRFVRGEAMLASYHPTSSVDEIASNTGWTLIVADDVHATELPTAQELRIIREYDPQGFWTRRGTD